MTRYVALVDGKPGSYGVTVPDLPAARPPLPPPMRSCAGRPRVCGCGLKTHSPTVRNCLSRVRSRPCAPIPKWRRRSQRAPRSQSYRSSSIRAGRLRQIFSLDAGLLAAIDEAAAARGTHPLSLLGERSAREDRKRGLIVCRAPPTMMRHPARSMRPRSSRSWSQCALRDLASTTRLDRDAALASPMLNVRRIVRKTLRFALRSAK